MNDSPCSPLTATLLDRLRDEEDLLREALGSLAELHAALRAGDLAAVQITQPRQETLAAALTTGQAARQTAAVRLALSVGLPVTGLSLSALAARLPAPDAAALRAARERLAGLTNELAESHRRNATLVHHLRSYFRAVVSTLSNADTPVRYGPSGSSLVAKAGAMIHARG